MKKHISSRVLSLILVLTLVLSLALPAGAVETEAATTESLSFELVDGNGVEKAHADISSAAEKVEYMPNDVVRVSIVMDEAATLSAGFSSENVAANTAAVSYRDSLKVKQDAVAAEIEKVTGETLDVVWNLTLAANLISANVKFAQIAEIEKVAGVKEVFIENRYEPQTAASADEPNMATSSFMIGSNVAWADGYTGAGTKVAVIDTGIDPDHQSFAESGYNYAMSLNAEEAGMSLEDYKASVGVLTMADVAAVADQLNINNSSFNHHINGFTAEAAYLSDKSPFAVNYIDANYVVDHDNDSQGEHGSHVAGIAASNRYIPQEDGTFVAALESVMTQGVAPDAQIVTMKVFGAAGGAYDSDYMAAIEDAIVLGCDSANLSLGSGNPGFATAGTYQSIMESLTECSTVVAMSAGNSGAWNDTPYDANAIPYLYLDDNSMATNGSPGSFTNSLGVASVDNDGSTGMPLMFKDKAVFYTETSGYTNPPIASTLTGEQTFVMFDNTGVDGDGNNLLAPYADLVAGKVAMVNRGASSFYQKMDAAAAAGAVACIIVNNQDGTINMDLSDAKSTIPCVSITLADGLEIREAAEAVTLEDGTVYYTGTMTASSEIMVVPGTSEYHTMSDFSSWGVPGSLTLKPEISAPGGNIYAVNGAIAGGESYELMSGTSMASPQVAGMAALVGQYIRENGLEEKTGLTARQLANSLLMATAEPMIEDYGEDGLGYYPVLRQGAGLANVGNAVTAKSYIMMDEESTASAADGKVKAELGDDPAREGVYEYGFTVNNFSDDAVDYSLYSDLFTQSLFSYDGQLYMDTWTMLLDADITYEVDGEEFVPEFGVEADVDMDGDTDNDDVQAILEFVAGNLNVEDIDSVVADFDMDGNVTSADAYLLLSYYKTASFTVDAGSSVHVSVKAVLSEDMKEALDYYYNGGAYIEGYTYVTPVSTVEGELTDVEYSVAVLGYYGSWTDASMFDNTSVVDVAYGTNTKIPYTGKTNTNGLYVRYGSSTTNNWFLGNPYMTEETFPEDRLAVSSDTNLYQFRYNLIRNAAALVGVVTNEAGEVIYTGNISNRVMGPYYYTNGGSWQGVSTSSYNLNKTVSALGAAEGEKITFGLYALPEYYADPATGTMTADEVKAVVESGVLGDGAAISYTAVVDNTAPVVTAVSKDLLTGNLTVTAQDDNYIAVVAVTNGSGKVYGQELPEQAASGEETSTTVDLTNAKVGTKVQVVVADYAGNEATYDVAYASEAVSYEGKMFAFTSNANLGAGWKMLDPATVAYTSSSNYSGMEAFSTSNVTVRAAEYVDGYVFIAGSDNALYAAKLDSLDAAKKVGTLSASVTDLAFNYADSKLYAVANADNVNTVYTVDLVTAEMTPAFTVSITNPRSSNADFLKLQMLAIDDEGTFYAVNNGNGTSTNYPYLYSWTAEQVVDGAVTALAPVVGGNSGNLGVQVNGNGSLAWDHDTDTLYMTNSYAVNAASGNNNNRLYVVNTETAKAAVTNSGTNGGRTYGIMNGLFVVPSASSLVKPATDATSVTISQTSLELLKGQEATLTAEVFPWTLADKSVTWTSADETVATVVDGVVTAVSVGTTTVIVASAVTPSVTATCDVTVTLPPEAQLSGLIYDADSIPNWSDFSSSAPEAATVVAQGDAYMSGVLAGDQIYTVSDGEMFAVDVDTYEVESLGEISADWSFSDGAPIPASMQKSYGGKIVAPCHGGTYFEVMNPEAGSLGYYDLSKNFGDDPMAAIAFAEGPTTYTYSGTTYTDALVYYVITESGALYKFTMYNAGDNMSQALVGETGIKLEGVSANSGLYASMYYVDGWLYLAAYTEGATAQLYAIDASNPAKNAVAGEFGEGVWPAVSLYQYTRPTELTVRLNETSAELYTGMTLNLKAKVLPTTYTGGVVWSSSNPEVASVEDGVVTALTTGTTTITATSVDTNAEGNTVSATCDIVVESKVSVDAKVNGLIGESYVEIDLNDLSTKEVGTAVVAYDAGGMASGKMWGMYGTQFVDDAAAKAYNMSSYVALDMANFPEIGAEDPASVIWVASSYLITFDIASPSINGWNLSSDLNIAALAYVGASADEESGTISNYYFAIATDGTLYLLETTADGYLNRYSLGNVGVTFSDRSALSMTYVWDGTATGMEGLVIADGTNMKMYWIAEPSSADAPTAAPLGKLDGTYICSLYNTMWDGISSVLNANPAVPELFHHGAGKSATMDVALADMVATQISTEPVNAVVGSTNASSASFKTRQDLRNADAVAAEGTVSVSVTEDVDATNGKYVVSYDPAVLTYVGNTSTATNVAVNAETEGAVVLAFASEEAFAAGNEIAALTFSYEGDYVDTVVTVVTVECNDELDLEDETVITVTQEDGGHDYVVTETVEATCTEDGSVTYTCSKCGDVKTETVTALGHDLTEVTTEATCVLAGNVSLVCSRCEYSALVSIIQPEGHKYELVGAKEATATEPGYTGDLVCSVCGDVLAEGHVIPAPECPSANFTDITADAWYHDAVDFVVSKGLMNGTSETTFEPETTMTRGMLVTVLWRYEGSPEAKACDFTDVNATDYFATAVAWAAENGVVNGVGGGKFDPDGAITREQMAAILYRYAALKGADVSKTTKLDEFPDGASVSSYAVDAMSWAVAEGIITGVKNGSVHYLEPQGNATRAQVATILMRYIEK